MPRLGPLFLLLVGTACAPDRPPRLQAETDPLEDLRCRDAIRATLDTWGATGGVLPGAPTAGFATSYRFPTGEVGTWVVVSARGTLAEVSRVRAEETIHRTFDRVCRPADRILEGSIPAGEEVGPAFTDADLREALRASEARAGLVVYAWSPHMPLSVDGWPELADAAAALDLVAIPVLIAHADMDFARREAARVGSPASALRTVASVELIMRDMQLHAPSILVFRGDRVSPVLPGYRNADGYQSFFESFLEGG